MNLSQRSHTIQPQPMFRIMEQAQELERQGRKIIHLEIGDTTGFVNERLRELVCEEAAKSRFGYSPSAGEMDLREAVAEMYSKAKGTTFTHENVAIGPANSLITQVLAAVTEPGDGVMFPAPGFPTYALAAKFLGLKPNEGEPRAIILNPESNPLGKYVSPAILETWAQSRRIPVLFDEAYRHFRYTVPVQIPHQENYLYLWSLSKESAAPGLRIGAVIGHPDVIRKVADFTSLTNSCTPGFIQLAAAKYLRSGGWCWPEISRDIPRRAKLATDIFRTATGLSYEPPDSAMYIWARVGSPWHYPAQGVAARILDEADVAVCPGESFGGEPNAFRISLCVPESDLIEGCNRIVEFANGLERRAA